MNVVATDQHSESLAAMSVRTSLCARERPESLSLSGNGESPVSVHSFPPEILSYIFLLGQGESRGDCAPILLSSYHDAPHANLPFELTISHVNSYWRDVAISTQLLWCRIIISVHSRSECVYTYLNRADGCLLDVRIEAANNNGCDLDPNILDAVCICIPSWRRCVIELELEEEAHPVITRLCDVTASNLQYMSLTLNDFEGASRALHIFRGGSPALSFVRLRGLAVRFFHPPLNAATTLHLDQTNFTVFRYDSFRQMLMSTKNLIHLSVYGDIIGAVPWPEANDRTLIRMRTLKSLRICGFSGYVYSGLLLNLEAPQLDSLILKGAIDSDLDLFLSSSVSSKFPDLHHLTFCDLSLSVESQYMQLFALFPSVIEFTSLNPAVHAAYVLRYLATPLQIDGSAPWPNLQRLNMILNFSEQSLIKNVVEWRINSDRPLAKLCFIAEQEHFLDLSDFEWLNDHVDMEAVEEFSDCWPRDLKFEDKDDYMLR
ncbi:uncharacterized protein BT62DRAFT_114082 [Guyanagaster necrorhizus]|uniref:F-box domain-containing protein n=1 Tax=Guyanagaster necrorhizus TaxID=856835 RepID=A0A9P8ASW6_9AGAR|nr:uncharacterized protein BT62DRAFT_114082 [Guyanagaster necrorhizus MCA 3950]KAG7446346.1 hypothetical protein BT62DRAFT_114082 [Guyanagaster necrorhizus MCA 3950]